MILSQAPDAGPGAAQSAPDFLCCVLISLFWNGTVPSMLLYTKVHKLVFDSTGFLCRDCPESHKTFKLCRDWWRLWGPSRDGPNIFLIMKGKQDFRKQSGLLWSKAMCVYFTNSSAGEVLAVKSVYIEFNPWNLCRSEGRKLTLKSCPLTTLKQIHHGIHSSHSWPGVVAVQAFNPSTQEIKADPPKPRPSQGYIVRVCTKEKNKTNKKNKKIRYHYRGRGRKTSSSSRPTWPT